MSSSSTSSDQPPPLQLASDTAQNGDQDDRTPTINVIVKTDHEEDASQQSQEPQQAAVAVSNPPVLISNLAASVAMARMANASFAEFTSNLNVQAPTASSAAAALAQASSMDSSAGTAFFTTQAVAALAGAQPAIILPPSTVNLVPTSPDTEGAPGTKREIRLLKNREAAKECRRKKKEYVRCLENRVAVLEAQNTKLMEELKTLKDMYCHKVEETGAPPQPGTMQVAMAPANATQVPDGVSVTVQTVPPGVNVALLNGMAAAAAAVNAAQQ